jgi:pilus assembly protein CpaC
MKPRPHGRPRSPGSPLYNLAWVAAILAGTWHGQQASAQQALEPVPGKTTTGFPAMSNVVQELPPRPQLGPIGIDPMVQLSKPDGEFEIIAGGARLLTLRQEIARDGKVRPLIAAGSQGVIDFDVINSRVIRIVGRRIGVTDLTILTDKNEHYIFRIHVVYDLETLRARLKELFPDALVNVRQSRETLFITGEVRDVIQMRNVLRFINSHMNAEQSVLLVRASGSSAGAGAGGPGAGGAAGGNGAGGGDPNAAPAGPDGAGGADAPADAPGIATPGAGGSSNVTQQVPGIQIINMLKIPGSQQVLLKVCVAEVNRSAFRQLGFSFNWGNGSMDLISSPATGTTFPFGLPAAAGALTAGTTSLSNSGAVFPTPFFAYTLAAMRSNSLARILAEPNLTTMSGSPASFLSGGEIPIPTPQAGAAGAAVVTISFKPFGTRVEFTPTVLDKETIRLTVTPEVSAPNFTLGVGVGGFTVPAFLSRRASATVEMREGQTMAIAGLLQLTQTNTRTGPPLLSDVPYVGALFRDTQTNRAETELMISVTPYLVEPLNPNQTPRRPGDEINEPNDLEAYLLGRLEGRTGRDARSTTKWDDPIGFRRIFNLEKRKVHGVVGFSD